MRLLAVRCAILAGLLPALAPVRRAQAQQADTPVVVARRFFAALASEDWDGAVKLMDIRPILQERDRLMTRARARHAESVTAGQLMQGDSTLSLAEAQMQAAIFERRAKAQPPMFTYRFSGVHDTTELLALAPERAAAAWLMKGDIRVQAREVEAAAHCPMPPPGAFPRWEPHTIIGAVESGDDAYVLHKDPQDALMRAGLHGQPPPILILHRAGGAWKIMPYDSMIMGTSVTYVGPASCSSR